MKEDEWDVMWCDVMTLGTRIGRGPALEQVPVLGFRQLGFGSSSTVLEELHGSSSRSDAAQASSGQGREGEEQGRRSQEAEAGGGQDLRAQEQEQEQECAEICAEPHPVGAAKP